MQIKRSIMYITEYNNIFNFTFYYMNTITGCAQMRDATCAVL